MTDKGYKGQMKTRWIYNKTVNICGIYYSLEEAFEFCWSSFADEHNTLLKSTRRSVKLNKFAFCTPWPPDLLCKHWFVSSVWNFCRWVADVPPRETSLSGHEREEASAVRRLRRREICNNTGHGGSTKACTLWQTGFPIPSCVLLMNYRTERSVFFVIIFVIMCLVTWAITVLW